MRVVGKPEAFRKGCGRAAETKAEPRGKYEGRSESPRLSAREAAEPRRAKQR